MPMFVIETNVLISAVPDSLLSELSMQLAKAMGKPTQYIAMHILRDQLMAFGGSLDPCVLCSLHSTGKITGPQNKGYSKQLCKQLTKHLKIPEDRLYINYYDLNAANMGWNGSTFA
ncbi:macrophage migration inhibitory factor-like [Dromiciops gliroides]|uniref:macrophage migration inhibitory factor-like n=1 Tax=Dromiciops gliroides TaxID=33562 RepID=UPI001CC3FFBF|nr:macrophage migration inhibitory factor-like [Dromiciops gliroides]